MQNTVFDTWSGRCDVIVLGDGIVGVCVALHLAKRGLSVVVVGRDPRGPGFATSYGNAGVIEGNTIFPYAFPTDPGRLAKIALKCATEADYHLSFLPHVTPWIASYWAHTRPTKLVETAYAMRPLFGRAIEEHLALLKECNALQYVRQNGWLKVYRTDLGLEAEKRELELARELRVEYEVLDQQEALKLEPHLRPIFEHAVLWKGAANITNPLKVTQAYAARFKELGGKIVQADAQLLTRRGTLWSVRTARGNVEADNVVVALGPWTPDILEPLGIHLPLGIKRGYHHHFARTAQCDLTRPTLDADVGYFFSPMEQGIRLTTGAEFADRDAPETPSQMHRLLPMARALMPVGAPLEEKPWMGCRPCFADSRPVVGPAPGQPKMWLVYGHAHWGLTLGPATGRLVAEMITGETPFCDPKPYSAQRFLT